MIAVSSSEEMMDDTEDQASGVGCVRVGPGSGGSSIAERGFAQPAEGIKIDFYDLALEDKKMYSTSFFIIFLSH